MCSFQMPSAVLGLCTLYTSKIFLVKQFITAICNGEIKLMIGMG